MKKQTAAAFIAAMTITTLTACGGPKQLSKSVTVELGKEDGIKVTDVLDVSKDKAKDVKIDTKKVNFYKEGKYDATLTYDKKEYKVTVKVKDTVPPEVTAKTDIQAEAGTPVHISDCIDKIVEASGNVEAEFETKPDSKDAAATETTERTESVSKADSTEKAYSSTTALGDVALNGNDEVVYVDRGDYDNCVVVSDAAGNKTKTEVKIHILGKPSLTGVTDKTVNVGDTVDYMTGVSSVGDRGEDLTSAIKVDSSAVNTNAAGTYQVTYSVTEPNGYTQTATCNVIVKEKSPAQTDNNNGGDSNNGGNTKPSGNNNGGNTKPSGNNNGGNTKPSGGSNGGSSNGSGSTKPAGGNNNGNTTPSGGNNSTPSNNNNNQPANNNNGGGNSGNVNKPAEDPGSYVTDCDGNKIKVDKSKWKYDTSEAQRLGQKGFWANGDVIDYNHGDFVDAGNGNNKDAAKYLVAAGMMSQWGYDGLYGD